MKNKYLIIADDLTGGADTGVQFAGRGLRTFLINFTGEENFDFSRYAAPEVLVVNTDSRGTQPALASALISRLMETYDPEIFPLIYKKIDSTFRGNIGSETEAVLKGANIPLAFVTPSLPKQGRIVAGGILMVSGRPVAETEISRDAVSPVTESHVGNLMGQQTSLRVGWVEQADVSAGPEALTTAVERERKQGTRIIIFDALEEGDLANIVAVGMAMEKTPLFVGSAGLAEQLAKRIASPSLDDDSLLEKRPFKHIFIVNGSASGVTHGQLAKFQKRNGIQVCRFEKSFFLRDKITRGAFERNISSLAVKALLGGCCVLEVCTERLPERLADGSLSRSVITAHLSSAVLSVLYELKPNPQEFVLLLTGGDTAVQVLKFLGVDAIEIEREIIEGIVMSRIPSGAWQGLPVVTKAGGFGKEDALEKTAELLLRGNDPA